MTWKLKKTKQCAKCPWRKDTSPRDIPNGYCEDKHKDLSATISDDPILSITEKRPNMACHETESAHCIGWLMNQLGPGNNIGLRMQMSDCENSKHIELVGEQHQKFVDTLPND